jgi:hypothetical protein
MRSKNKMNDGFSIQMENKTGLHSEIARLFDQMNIPMDEQKILWRMAGSSIGCFQLRNILTGLLHRDFINKEPGIPTSTFVPFR